MSTRGLYGYIENGEYTANYNHSDSYPSGLGVEFWTACRQNDLSGFSIREERIDFIKHSLFCEWAYFYDRDNRIFEIWKGFQTQADINNQFGQESDGGYYPCKRIFRGKIDILSADLFDSNLVNHLISIDRDEKIDSILK